MHAVCGVFVCVSKVAGSVNQRSNQQQQNAIIKCFRVIIQLHSRASFKATRATVVYTPKHHENHDSDKFCCSSTPFFTVISLPAKGELIARHCELWRIHLRFFHKL